MSRIPRRSLRALSCLAVAGGLVTVAASAHGADIYWAESSNATAGFPVGRIGSAPLAGGGTAATWLEVSGRPSRVAVVGGRVTWNTIAAAPYTIGAWNLAKTGTATTAFSGAQAADFGAGAIDAGTGKIWFGVRGANGTAGLVQVANLDGSGTPTTLYTRAADLTVGATVIDVAGNRVYWCEFPGAGATGDIAGSVMRGSLDGSATPVELFANEFGCNGLAIDTASGKAYWARYQTSRNQDTNSLIRVGNLDGSGAATTLYTEGNASSSGLALDPATGMLYWANQPVTQTAPGTGAIRVGHISGSPAAADLYAGLSNPNGVSLDGTGTAPAPAPAPAPTPAPITKVVTKVGNVSISRAPGVRGAARRVSLTLRYDEGGRFSLFVQRPNGKRWTLLPGTRIGTRVLAQMASAPVVANGADNAKVRLQLLLGGATVPKGTLLRVVYRPTTGAIVKQNIPLR